MFEHDKPYFGALSYNGYKLKERLHSIVFLPLATNFAIKLMCIGESNLYASILSLSAHCI